MFAPKKKKQKVVLALIPNFPVGKNNPTKASPAPLALPAIWAGCAAQAAPVPPAPPQVTVAKAIELNIDEFDEFTGRLEAVDVVAVRPRVAGLLQRVAFREGTEVRPGDVLFTIDPRPYRSELDRARAELLRVTSRAQLAHSEVERSRTLV